jgi:hypothetical protein
MPKGEISPRSDAPCACVLFPIIDLGDGTLFYCDYYPTSCADSPEAAYAVEDESTPWPYQDCGCVLCFATPGLAKKPQKNNKRFPGLRSPVEPSYQHEGLVPAGRARECTSILVDPNLEYIQFRLSEKTISAKVLVFVWKTGQATDGKPKNLATRIRYIAFQANEIPAGAKCETVVVAPIFSDEKPCYAYHCVNLPKGAPTSIMVLLAK